MLSLQLKDGEYLTIGDDIVIQVSSNAAIKLYVTAPRDKAILRGAVLERGGEKRPDFLFGSREKRAKRGKEAPAGALSNTKVSNG